MDEALKLQRLHPIIGSVVRRLTCTNPELDPTELFHEGQIVALMALRSHDAEKSSLTYWVYGCVYRSFINKLRSKCWKQRMQRPESSEIVQMEHRRFDLNGFISELSDEAACAVGLALDKELCRSGIVKTLQRELGWEASLISQVFQEVKEALDGR